MTQLLIAFIFAYCFFIGWHTSKTRTAHIAIFLIFPLFFTGLSVYMLSSKPSLYLYSYIIAFAIADLYGWLQAKKLMINPGKAKNTITVQGSWHLMICLMGIFLTKTAYGFAQDCCPEMIAKYGHVEWLFTGLFTGFLVGRSLNFLIRFMRAK